MRPPDQDTTERGLAATLGTLEAVLKQLRELKLEVPRNYYGVNWQLVAEEVVPSWREYMDRINEWDALPSYAGEGI